MKEIRCASSFFCFFCEDRGEEFLGGRAARFSPASKNVLKLGRKPIQIRPKKLTLMRITPPVC